jgi:hypothetical protein
VIEDWQAWGLAAAVGVAIAAAIVARVLLPGARERLPVEHVAAAAIIGVLAWEAAIQLPGNLISFLSIGAGLGGFIVTPLQVYVVAASLSTIAMFVAVALLLRQLRRPVRPVAVVDGITDIDADLTIEDASELVAGQS